MTEFVTPSVTESVTDNVAESVVSSVPAPVVPSDVDLRRLCPYMPLNVEQLLNSDTWLLATGDEAKAAVTLWCKAWHQVPAGSLPSNDKILAKLSGADDWESVKTIALRGFVLCSDGRYYHQIIADKAIEAWLTRRGNQDKTAAARAAVAERRQSLLQTRLRVGNGPDTDPVTEVVTDNVTGGNRREEKRNKKDARESRFSAEEFEEFWKLWPNRVGKATAQKAFPKALGQIPLATLLEGVGRYVANKPADRPWLNPATWLNQQRWNDAPAQQADLPMGWSKTASGRVLNEHGVTPMHPGAGG